MRTYEEIVEDMKQSFFGLSGYIPDEASDLGIRMNVLAGEIYNAQTYLEWIKRQVFPQTAQGEYLDYHAQMRGLERKEAVKAVGEVEFIVEFLVVVAQAYHLEQIDIGRTGAHDAVDDGVALHHVVDEKWVGG